MQRIALQLFFVVVFTASFGYAWNVTNGKLMDPNGNHVRVQGVSLSCTEFDSPIDTNADGSLVCPMIANRTASPYLKELLSWNTQIIRIPVNSQWYMWDLDTGYPAGPSGCKFASTWAGKPSPYGAYSPSGYRDWIDDHVNAITGLGMIAMIDLHWSDMEGTACCDNGAGGCYAGCQQTMADRKSVKFWEYVAKKYRNRMDVWFELYNEPAYWLQNQGGTNIPTLMKGGTMTASFKNGCPESPETTFTFVGMQDLYNAVRDTSNADNIVVIGGADFSWSVNGIIVEPKKPAPGKEWCHNQICQEGCGISPGIDNMLEGSPRGEGYPSPLSWSNKTWGLNVIYATHPYQGKGGQRPTSGEACSAWVDTAINGTNQLCSEECGWEKAFGFLTDYAPVIATEMGPWSGFSCDGSYISCQLDWFKGKGISSTPWAYWGNHAAQCNTFPTLVDENWKANGYGDAVKAYMTQSAPPYLAK